MGWDFCENWRSVADVKAALLRDWKDAGYTVLAEGDGRNYADDTMPTQVWWVALQGRGLAFIMCVLVAPEAGPRFSPTGTPWYGYKSIPESMGPAYDCCPERVFRSVPVPTPAENFGREWRQRVLRFAPWAKVRA